MSIRQVLPYLRVRNCAAALDFYERAFGAVEQFRLTEPAGRIGHAELLFGGCVVMVSEEFPEYNIQGPESVGGTGSAVHLQTDAVDSLTEQAVNAGAVLLMPPTDMFYGERSAKVRDPFGHEWILSTRIADVTPEEMQRRYLELMQESGE